MLPPTLGALGKLVAALSKYIIAAPFKIIMYIYNSNTKPTCLYIKIGLIFEKVLIKYFLIYRKVLYKII
jgi:hypothetical protein